jgi:hypothetical protein
MKSCVCLSCDDVFSSATSARARAVVDGQVAVEGEGLAVQSGRHEPEQDGRRTDQRHDFDAHRVSGARCQRARIGDAGTARVGNHAGAASATNRFEQCAQMSAGALGRQFDDFQFAQRTRMFQSFQRRTGGFRAFDQKVVEPLGAFTHRGRGVGLPVRADVQRAGQHVQHAARVFGVHGSG